MDAISDQAQRRDEIGSRHCTHVLKWISHLPTMKLEMRNEALKTLNSKRKKATLIRWLLYLIRRLEMTYSHMGRPHTTIGAIAFHF